MRKYLLLLSLGVIGSAYASPEGFYVGIDAGGAFQNFIYNNNSLSSINSQLSSSQLVVSGTAPGLQLGAFGGYNFTRNWGVELGYQYMFNSSNITGAGIGNATIDTGTYNLNSQVVDLVAVGRLPIEDSNFAVYGKLGLAYANAQFGQYCTPSVCANGTLPSGSGLTMAGGIGLQYMITNNWDTHLELMNYGGVLPINISSGGNTVGYWSDTSVTLAAAWHF